MLETLPIGTLTFSFISYVHVDDEDLVSGDANASSTNENVCDCGFQSQRWPLRVDDRDGHRYGCADAHAV